MAKASNRASGQKEKNEQQMRIQKMRDELNRSDSEAIPVFTRYKNITYLANVICPPYGLFRIWQKGSEFTSMERMIQTVVCVLIGFYFISMRYGY